MTASDGTAPGSAAPSLPAGGCPAAPAGGPAPETPAGGDTAEARARVRQSTPGFKLGCGTGGEVAHVGIVFVHGIGSQEEGATLLDWGSKIIALLLDARALIGAAGDPVIDCQLDPSGSSSLFIELQLPKARNRDGVEVHEQHWVMTEAWWAQRVRPPAFGEMAEWLGPRGAIKRVVAAMVPRPRSDHDPRLRPRVMVRHLQRVAFAGRRSLWDLIRSQAPADRSVIKEDAEIGSVYGAPRSTRWPVLDKAISDAKDIVSGFGTVLATIGVGLYFQAVSALVLVLYGALRSVEKVLPIGPLKNGALTRPIDRFMLDWFGDVYVLLGDPAQSASVRGRLLDALNDLHANDCDSVAIVAHSGGAIVSYMTLADATRTSLRVDHLITLGEGLNLAWRLTTGDDGTVDPATRQRYDRLYSDMLAMRTDLRWDDFWASQDPAPVGVLTPPDVQSMGAESLARVATHAIWNRLAFGEDHGTYWDNDEEFLIPLARLLDKNTVGARMFADTTEDQRRSNRRRRRLSFLSIWRQLALVAPTTAIVTSFALGSDAIRGVGAAVASAWSRLPGNDVISGPVTALRGLDLSQNPVADFLAEAGVWVIVAVFGLLTLVALLPPSERPVPWYDPEKSWWRPFNLFARFLRFVPWIVALPVLAVLVMAWFRFSGGATATGVEAGDVILRVFLATLAVASIASVMFASPGALGWVPSWARDGVELTVTILVMAVVAVLAVAPMVAIAAFEDTGTTVLGMASIVIAFQILGRIGTWRWNVWDGRERVAARIQKPYPPVLRIFVQMTLLTATVVSAFAAVVSGSSTLALLAVAGAAIEVLLGVAVDVLDAARQQRRNPLDAMLQGASHT